MGDAACEWEGKLGARNAHLKVCPFQVVDCGHKGEGCAIRVPRRNMDIHLTNHCRFRQASCSYCSKTMTFRALVRHEQNKCPSVQVACLACNEFIEREEMSRHTAELCPKAVVACPFIDVGGSSFTVKNTTRCFPKGMVAYTGNKWGWAMFFESKEQLWVARKLGSDTLTIVARSPC